MHQNTKSTPTIYSCGIVDFYGPTDITKMNDAPTTADYTVADSPVGILIGKLDVTKHEDKAQKANVLNYITMGRDIPPIIIFHGSKDRIVPFEQSAMLHEKLLAEQNYGTRPLWPRILAR